MILSSFKQVDWFELIHKTTFGSLKKTGQAITNRRHKVNKNLTRSENNGQLAGVAAGLANYFDVDVTLVRLLFVLFTLMGGLGLLVYIILAIVMPTETSMIKEDVNTEKEPMVA